MRYVKCPKCKSYNVSKDQSNEGYVCNECGHEFVEYQSTGLERLADKIFDLTGLDFSDFAHMVSVNNRVIYKKIKKITPDIPEKFIGWIKSPFSKVAVSIIVILLFVITLQALSRNNISTSKDYTNIEQLTQTDNFQKTTSMTAASATTETQTQTTTITTTTAPTTTTTTEKKITAYSADMYKVGVDIPAGEYVLLSIGQSSSYFSVCKDSSGSLDSIITNDNFKRCSYISVSDGQYLEFTKAIAYPSDEISKFGTDYNGCLTSGMYKVGKDIAPGEYKVIADDGYGYYAIYSSSKQRLSDIVSNDNFEASKYVTLKKGQYIKLSNASIKVE